MNVMKSEKLILSIIIHMFASVAVLSGLEIAFIPISYYELRGTNFVQGSYKRDITEDIANRLNKYYDTRIIKMTLSDPRAGVTALDARRAADVNQVNEVLYGVVRDSGSSLVAELNIYNRRSEDVGVIYASDASDMYERLINTLVGQILDWYRTNVDKIDALRNEVRDLRTEINSKNVGEEAITKREEARAERARAKREAMEGVEKEFALRIPITVGYWSYMESVWVEMIQGTVEVTTGVQMYPEMQFPALFGMKNELSFGLQIGYRNGVTRNRDNVIMNGLLINPSVGYHLNFYSMNWLYIGTGVFYELSMWEIEDIDYNERQSYMQSLTGYILTLDYSYRFNRLLTVNFGTNFYGYFGFGTSPVVRVYFGTVITVLGGLSER